MNTPEIQISPGTEEMLVNYFPDCGRVELLDYLHVCQGDLNLVINNLLDDGYEMKGNGEETRRNDDAKSSNDGDSPFSDATPPSPSSSSPLPETDGQPKQTSSSKSSSPSSSASPPSSPSSGSGSTNGESNSIATTEASSSQSDDDSESAIDGEDWVEVELCPELVNYLVESYGDDFLAYDNKVKVPPNIAFELYRLLYANVCKLRKQQEEDELMKVISKYGNSNPHNSTKNELPFPIDEEIEQKEIKMLFQKISSMESMRGQDLTFAEIQERDRQIAEQSSRIRELYALKRTMAQTIKFAQLQHAFPNLKRSEIEDVFVQCHLDYDKALTHLKDMYPKSFVEQGRKKEEVPVCRSIFPFDERNLLLKYDPQEVAKIGPAEKRQYIELAEIWKTEFEEIQNCVTEYQAKINTYRHMPETLQYFREKANDWHEKLKVTQDEYQFYIVYGSNAGSDPNKIDLHGLTVKYALKVVAAYLQNRSNWAKNHMPENHPLKVRIITGRGRHSPNNIPKLNPAVRSYLIKNHYSFSEGDRELDGSFGVQVGRSAAIKRNNFLPRNIRRN